jgi:hypothetical protein
MRPKDIILSEGIVNGDFVVDYSETQEIEFLFRTQKGQYYESLLTGIGLVNELNSTIERQDFINKATEQLKLDGFTNVTVELVSDGDEYIINANGLKE